MSKAVVFFAEGTEECEALLVVDLLRRARVDVTVASASGNRAITSSHKVYITADALAEDIDYSDVDMVVLPGGIPGTPNLAANKTVTDTCVAFAKAGKKVALAHFTYLNPLPKNTETVLKKYKKVVVAEQNLGQFAGYLRMKIDNFTPYQFNEVKGQPFVVAELVAAFNKLIDN